MNNYKEISRTLAVSVCIGLTILLACAALMFILGIREDIHSPPKAPADNTGISDPTLESTYDYGDIYLHQMIIFCDSVFSNIEKHGILNDSSIIITGQDGDMPLDFNSSSAQINRPSSQGGAQSITDIAAEQTPQYLIICIGLKNGVEHCSEEKFKQYYQKLIDSVNAASPDTKIIVASILPTSQNVSKNQPAISADKIERANKWIYQLALSNSLRYLDLSEALKNDKGYIKNEYDSGDGIHPNKQGYLALIEYIKTHGYK